MLFVGSEFPDYKSRREDYYKSRREDWNVLPFKIIVFFLLQLSEVKCLLKILNGQFLIILCYETRNITIKKLQLSIRGLPFLLFMFYWSVIYHFIEKIQLIKQMQIIGDKCKTAEKKFYQSERSQSETLTRACKNK